MSLIEWLVAVAFTPEWADQFLGQQGDPFDAQKDMTLATAGALVSIGLLAHRALVAEVADNCETGVWRNRIEWQCDPIAIGSRGAYMTISSRTPEGVPNRCPVCGHRVIVEPSLGTNDAPCPRCGHLLWWLQQRMGGTAAMGRISADTRLTECTREVGVDSLDVVELVMELEEEFDLTISDEEARQIATVGDVIRYIESRREVDHEGRASREPCGIARWQSWRRC